VKTRPMLQARGWMINLCEAAQKFPQNLTPAKLAAPSHAQIERGSAGWSEFQG
jgi:hypothetical protein